MSFVTKDTHSADPLPSEQLGLVSIGMLSQSIQGRRVGGGGGVRLGLHTSSILQYYVNWCADMPQTDEERMRANLHCVGDSFTTISEGTVGT